MSDEEFKLAAFMLAADARALLDAARSRCEHDELAHAAAKAVDAAQAVDELANSRVTP